MVVDESPLELLFRPEEIELLICGSKVSTSMLCLFHGSMWNTAFVSFGGGGSEAKLPVGDLQLFLLYFIGNNG